MRLGVTMMTPLAVVATMLLLLLLLPEAGASPSPRPRQEIELLPMPGTVRDDLQRLLAEYVAVECEAFAVRHAARPTRLAQCTALREYVRHVVRDGELAEFAGALGASALELLRALTQADAMRRLRALMISAKGRGQRLQLAEGAVVDVFDVLFWPHAAQALAAARERVHARLTPCITEAGPPVRALSDVGACAVFWRDDGILDDCRPPLPGDAAALRFEFGNGHAMSAAAADALTGGAVLPRRAPAPPGDEVLRRELWTLVLGAGDSPAKRCEMSRRARITNQPGTPGARRPRPLRYY